MTNRAAVLVARVLASLVVLLAAAALAAPPAVGAPSASAADKAAKAPRKGGPRDRTCFLLAEIGKGEIVREGGDCDSRTSPASTFKIPHSLIALETGVITADEVVTIEGKQPIAAWAGPHTLKTAMRFSVVPYYQRTARLIGRERMTGWLAKLDYGNRDAEGQIDLFWINGVLRISPPEQVAFLEKLFTGKLPVSEKTVAIVKDAILQRPGTYFAAGKENAIEGAPGEEPASTATGGGRRPEHPEVAKLWAKSGSFVRGPNRVSRVGWYVGAVERGGKTYLFASRVRGVDDWSAASAQAIRGLKKAGVL